MTVYCLPSQRMCHVTLVSMWFSLSILCWSSSPADLSKSVRQLIRSSLTWSWRCLRKHNWITCKLINRMHLITVLIEIENELHRSKILINNFPRCTIGLLARNPSPRLINTIKSSDNLTILTKNGKNLEITQFRINLQLHKGKCHRSVHEFHLGAKALMTEVIEKAVICLIFNHKKENPFSAFLFALPHSMINRPN